MTKTDIFNLTLNKLLLRRQIANSETDNSNEAKVLRDNWQSALNQTLADLDLDSCMKKATLALQESTPNEIWEYAYAYPSDCVLFRRILNEFDTYRDDRATHIEKQIAQNDGAKVIFTNEQSAQAEYISNAVVIDELHDTIAECISDRLGIRSAPLIVGKGARTLRKDLKEDYIIHKAEAQEVDALESFSYTDERFKSEFVRARTE